MSRFHISAAMVVVASLALVWGCTESTTPPAETGVILGTVTHTFADTPVAGVTVSAGGRSASTSANGTYRLDGVPQGDHPPYVPVDRQVMISAEGQDIDVQLYRQIEVVQPLTEDSYIFTGQDSLNANRGQVPVLWASPSLGRRILLGLPPVAAQWAGREVVHVQVEFFACVQPDDPQWAGEADVTVGVHRLTGTFHENSVDYFSRPGSMPLSGLTMDAPLGLPPTQLVSVDVTAAYQAVVPWPGIALTVTDGHLGLFVASSEYGDDGEPEAERRPRVRFMLLD